MNENDILIARMNDLASRAAITGLAASKFLTPAESQGVAEVFTRRRDTAFTLDGGFEGAERTRAIFILRYHVGGYHNMEDYATHKDFTIVENTWAIFPGSGTQEDIQALQVRIVSE